MEQVIDKQLGTNFWTKNISKETANVYIEFDNIDDITPDDTRKWNIKPGYERFNVHMILDINMDGNFNRKVILVANGHTTASP